MYKRQDIGVALQHIFDQRRFHSAHTQGVGKQDGGLQRTQLIDLDKARGLAKAVDDMAGRQHLIMEHIPGVGQQRGHTGLDAFSYTHLDVYKRQVAVQADVSTAEGCKKLFEDAVNAFGRVDILCLLYTSYFQTNNDYYSTVFSKIYIY